jgi:hypothetical protein
VKLVHSFGQLASVFRCPKSVFDADSLDHQNLVVHLDITLYFRAQITLCQFDATRFQRASEGTGESPSSCGDNIVQSGSVFWEPFGVHPIVLGDL